LIRGGGVRFAGFTHGGRVTVLYFSSAAGHLNQTFFAELF
jgi:hypothetical protein